MANLEMTKIKATHKPGTFKKNNVLKKLEESSSFFFKHKPDHYNINF